MFDVIFIVTNTNIAALAVPNWLNVLCADQNTRENANGIKIKLSITATYESGLKLCVSPSEIGNTKKKINHITLNQKIPNDTGKIKFKKLCLSRRWNFILANPITEPMVTIIIPKANVMWVGLSHQFQITHAKENPQDLQLFVIMPQK